LLTCIKVFSSPAYRIVRIEDGLHAIPVEPHHTRME
jgi:hypothetical protein